MFTAESDSEIILKIGQHCRSYGQLSTGLFFLMKHGVQGGPEKTAQTLMRYNFSTAGHRVTRFPAKCSETNW